MEILWKRKLWGYWRVFLAGIVVVEALLIWMKYAPKSKVVCNEEAAHFQGMLVEAEKSRITRGSRPVACDQKERSCEQILQLRIPNHLVVHSVVVFIDEDGHEWWRAVTYSICGTPFHTLTYDSRDEQSSSVGH